MKNVCFLFLMTISFHIQAENCDHFNYRGENGENYLKCDFKTVDGNGSTILQIAYKENVFKAYTDWSETPDEYILDSAKRKLKGKSFQYIGNCNESEGTISIKYFEEGFEPFTMTFDLQGNKKDVPSEGTTLIIETSGPQDSWEARNVCYPYTP